MINWLIWLKPKWIWNIKRNENTKKIENHKISLKQMIQIIHQKRRIVVFSSYSLPAILLRDINERSL